MLLAIQIKWGQSYGGIYINFFEGLHQDSLDYKCKSGLDSDFDYNNAESD